MYKILCNGTLFFDTRVEELALVDPILTLEENKAGSFSFTVPPTHPRYDDIQRRKTLIQVYQDNVTDANMLFSGVAIEAETDFYKQKKVYCEGELTYLNDSIQRPARYQGVTVRGLLENYINNHNAQVETAKRFTLGMVTVTDPNNYIYCYSNNESTMKCLKEDLVDDLGGYFRVRYQNGVRYLDYLADSMHTNTQVIQLGVNLVEFKSNIDSTDIATAVIPLGAKQETSTVEGLETRLTIESVNGGKDYVFNQDAVNNYGWIYKTIEFDNVTTPANLKKKGEKYLQETQFETVTIEASAVDMHLAEKETERFHLSDQIRVVSKPHGLDKYFRLTKQTINLNDPSGDRITLGKNEKNTLSAMSSQVSEAIRQVVEAIVEESKIVRLAKDNATALINGNGDNGYVVMHTNDAGKPFEILVMDTPDIKTATKVWRWNVNGLGYSNTGYNGQYGLAMTMDGAIVADFITSGTLDATKANITNLNASNITSGTMSANKISGGSIDATNVTITNLNADNITSGTIDANVIGVTNLNADNITSGTMSADKVQGGTLTAGGVNNTDGTIKVLKSDGRTEAVKMDNTGIHVSAGDILIGQDTGNNPYFKVNTSGDVTARNVTINYLVAENSAVIRASASCQEKFSILKNAEGDAELFVDGKAQIEGNANVEGTLSAGAIAIQGHILTLGANNTVKWT